jgi:hypothetical protein
MRAMKTRSASVAAIAAFVFGCSRSQAPSASAEPSARAAPTPAATTAAVSPAAGSPAVPPAASTPAVPPAASTPATSSTAASLLAAPSSSAPSRVRVAKTRDACAACNGQWGRHGIAETESCNCRTADKGKICRDGRDCGGECIVDPALFEVVETGPPVRGRFRGRCSEFVTAFGCNALLSDGAANAQPVPKDQPPEELCVD